MTDAFGQRGRESRKGVKDQFCPECGTNLSARDRKRERRRKWMKHDREKRKREKGDKG